MVVNEMRELVDKYHIEKLTFVDDDFFGTNTEGIARAEQMFTLIIQSGIKLKLYMNARVASVQELIRRGLLQLAAQAGVKYFFIGFESYNDDILKSYHKGITTKDTDAIVGQLHMFHIDVNPGMITFDLDVSPEQVKRNVDLLKRLRYYDLFMFTRTLMRLPTVEVGIRDNRIRHGDFTLPETEMLYNALVNLRDRLYPLCGTVDRNRIMDRERDAIVSLHFAAFYDLLDICTGKHVDSLESIIEHCVEKKAAIISTIAYGS